MSPIAVPSLEHRSAEELDIRRVRRGKGFSYHHPDGSRVSDAETLERIRGIVIPPAWTDVRVSDAPASHLQAVGRDARGRLQYRYHPHWTEFRDRVKFDRLPVFASSLPAIRRRIDADLSSVGVSREKVLATVVELLQITLIRVGNEEYARDNGAYGLTTFRNKHAEVNGAEIAFVFTGKSGLQHEVRAQDRRVARVLQHCQEIPGQRLFQYLDDGGRPVAIHSHDVNDYLREAGDADITTKDFRTWVATVTAAGTLGRLDPPASEREAQALVRDVIDTVAEDLGNTPAVCRASYIHPRVLTSFGTGELHEAWQETPPRKARLTADERRTRALLSGRRGRRTAPMTGSVDRTQRRAS
jgi:DNA topoisomerase-1